METELVQSCGGNLEVAGDPRHGDCDEEVCRIVFQESGP